MRISDWSSDVCSSDLSISKANMRYAKKAPDVSDILPTVRARGVLVPLIVRPNCSPDAYEIVACARRFTAAKIVADERGTGPGDPLPCAFLDHGADAAAIQASTIDIIANIGTASRRKRGRRYGVRWGVRGQLKKK